MVVGLLVFLAQAQQPGEGIGTQDTADHIFNAAFKALIINRFPL